MRPVPFEVPSTKLIGISLTSGLFFSEPVDVVAGIEDGIYFPVSGAVPVTTSGSGLLVVPCTFFGGVPALDEPWVSLPPWSTITLLMGSPPAANSVGQAVA